MIKILQVITLSEIGGAQKVLYDLVKFLHEKENFEFHVACAPGGEIVPELRQMGVKVFELPELIRQVAPGQDFAALRRIYRLIKKHKYAVVHCHSSKAGILGRLAAKLAGVPRIIFTVHGWGVTPLQSPVKRFFFGSLEKLAGQVATDIVCVSQADFDLGRKYVARAKLRLIYNGVEASSGSSGKLRREIGAGENDIVIGMVARLKEPKDPFMFLQAGERIIGTGKGHMHFVLIGDGPLGSECRNFVTGRNLESRIHLLGTRMDLPDLYPDLDIFTLFSFWEGLPLTICEGMMAGLPVMASRVGGVGEQVTHGWNGFLLEPRDVDGAVDYLNQLILDRDLRRKMGANSKKRAEELFRVDRMAEEYRRLYLKNSDG